MTGSPSAVRPPLQDRSRASWARVLDAGLALLEEDGADALTVAAVCRRAQISPPSLYARVDGRSGLFHAVYEHGMTGVARSEDERLRAVDGSARAVVDAVTAVFDRHRAFLRAVMVASSSDRALLERGAQESRRFADRVAQVLPTADPEAGRSAARALYEANSFRTLHGDAFWSPGGEHRDAFIDRTTRLVDTILG